MAQKVIYTCENCKKEIGVKKHISLVMSGVEVCGIAIPPQGGEGRWDVQKFDFHNFIHFCSGRCVGQFFGRALKEAKGSF